MEIIPLEALDFFRKSLADPSLKVVVSSDFAASKPNYRERLREASLAAPAVGISRSHTLTCGGYAQSDERGCGLGFDLEIPDRLTHKIISRIATPSELAEAGASWPLLWVAKEACFKALAGPQQPRAFTEVVIGQWRWIDSHFGTCRWLESQRSGIGAIYWNTQIICGVFKIH